MKPKAPVEEDNQLLLHTCCAPCSAAIIEWLLDGGVIPTLFFFNPNIEPLAEYEKRKKELQRYARSLNLAFIDGDYDHSLWLDAVAGLEDQPERGLRCSACFKWRLKATARLAQEKGFKRIATTLASSRWKNPEQIAEAGRWAAAQFPPVEFWDKNWRKDGLSERRRILLKENAFYNQTYCGCEFSQH
jgi:predicted adenine nucleotide alpha hydrolase (AANH) superfamily ATPase